MSEAGAARSTRSVVAVLGTTQTIAWASSYYLPAVLGMATGFMVEKNQV